MNVHDYAEQVRANELFDLFAPQAQDLLNALHDAVTAEAPDLRHNVIHDAQMAALTILGHPARLITPELVLTMTRAAHCGLRTTEAMRNYLMKAHTFITLADEPVTYTLD